MYLFIILAALVFHITRPLTTALLLVAHFHCVFVSGSIIQLEVALPSQQVPVFEFPGPLGFQNQCFSPLRD